MKRASMSVDGRTRCFAVFGHPIGHTFSPMIHELFIRECGENLAYLAFDVTPENLEDALRGAWAMGFRGLNLTIPLKERVIPYLTGIDPLARKVGAVNTLKRTEEGFYGYNTDVYGMQSQLRTNGIHLQGQDVVILGAGGAAKSALCVCQMEGAESVSVYNRTYERATELVRRFEEACRGEETPRMRAVSLEELLSMPHPYVIQTTPAGMLSVSDRLPIREESFYEDIRYAADVVFNPKDTPFLSLVRSHGGKGADGLSMLYYQALKAFEIWRETAFSKEQALRMKEEFLSWAEDFFHE